MHEYDHDDEDVIADTQTSTFENQDRDQVIWTGRPSQWINLPTIIFYCLLGYGALYGQWALKTTRYAWEYSQYMPYLDYAVNGLLLILVLKTLHKMLSVFYTKYELTNERLIEYTGITKFLQNGEPLELYNVFDYKFPPPFLLALWGRGSLILQTHDANQPVVNLRAIAQRRNVYENIRKRVEVLRISKKSYFNGPSA